MTTAFAERALSARHRGKSARGMMLTLGAGALVAVTLLPASAQARGVPDGFADLAAKVKPAVVSIAVERDVGQVTTRRSVPNFRNPFPEGTPNHEFFKRRFQGPDQGRPGQRGFRQPDPRGKIFPRRKARAVGSGFVIDAAGYVVTNNHVIRRATKVEVIFDGGKRYTAKIIGRDAKTDLALLKIKGDKPFPTVEWGDSDKARIGDWIMAVGNPYGLSSTVTAGIISARGRALRSASLVDFLQIDASINKGNSGGPTFNMDGKVVGVNTAIYSPTGGSVGLGFAIPSNLARQVIAQLRANGGKISRGWLGVQIQTVSAEIAKAVGLDEARGALVASVVPQSPARKAGVRPGDVIVSWAGKNIKDIRDLVRKVAFTKAGESVSVIVWRQGSRKTLTVNVGESGAKQAAAGSGRSEDGQIKPSAASLGLTVAPLNAELRRQYRLKDDVRGLVVLNVDQASPAAAKGMRRGDVLTHVNGDEIKSVAAMQDLVKKARAAKREAILLRVLRANRPLFVALKLS